MPTYPVAEREAGLVEHPEGAVEREHLRAGQVGAVQAQLQRHERRAVVRLERPHRQLRVRGRQAARAHPALVQVALDLCSVS